MLCEIPANPVLSSLDEDTSYLHLLMLPRNPGHYLHIRWRVPPHEIFSRSPSYMSAVPDQVRDGVVPSLRLWQSSRTHLSHASFAAIAIGGPLRIGVASAKLQSLCSDSHPPSVEVLMLRFPFDWGCALAVGFPSVREVLVAGALAPSVRVLARSFLAPSDEVLARAGVVLAPSDEVLASLAPSD